MATILVVEDDKLSQRLLGKILASVGHISLAAETGPEAWEILQKAPLVDLVILDNQLGKGWGWELLQRLRGDLVFQHLPVVVYTAHTERSSILKYVELRVQTMLVKPYKTEVVLQEVTKAIAADWVSRLIEPAEAASKRLGLKLPDYYSTINATASALEKSIAEIRAALASRPSDPRIDEHLTRIGNEAVTLGIPALRSSADALGRSIAQRNLPDSRIELAHLEALYSLIRHRAHAYLGIGNLVSSSASKLAPVKAPAPVYDTKGPAKSLLASQLRLTTAAPLWVFGQFARDLPLDRKALSERLRRRYLDQARPPLITALVSVAEYCRGLPHLGLDELRAAISALPAFETVFLNITKRLGALDDEHTTLDTSLAIHRLGVFRSGVLLACARIAQAHPANSPLDVSLLLQQTMATGLIAYELGHSLRVGEEHQCAAAGFTHNVGQWILALSEPLLFGLVLGATATADSASSSAEEEILGLSHHDLGADFLSNAVKWPVLVEVARHYSHPTGSGASDAIVTAVVHLATQLVTAAQSETPEQAKTARASLLRADHPAWSTLQKAGIELPLEVPELSDSLLEVSQTSLWIVSVIAEWGRQQK